MSERLHLDGRSLTRADVVAVAREGRLVDLDVDAIVRVRKAAEFVERIVAEDRTAYGVNTGFGRNAGIRLDSEEAARRLQRNLILTHAACVGEPLPTDVVRAMMVLRINTLLQGHSGIRPETLQALTAMLNERVHPVIPEKGSVGASGDLAPLSHMVMPLLGAGEAEFGGERMSGADAMAAAGIPIVELTHKEGLALNNGTAQITAHAVLALHDLERLVATADVAAALSLEAKAGRLDAFDPAVHALRPHPGQVATAARIRALVDGSTLCDIEPERILDAHGDVAKSSSPQDAYSLRCAPAVHGAVRDALAHAARVVDVELNAVTDNPLLFPGDDRVLSAGNFHGMPLALAMSAVKASLPVLASICERRIAMLVDAATNDGLPMFLVDNDDGAQSGHMLLQYTAAALVNDLATRSHPAPTINVPTCANAEDQVSMGTNEARHVHAMTSDLEWVVALEVLVATQALSVRMRRLSRSSGSVEPAPGAGTGAALRAVRRHVEELVVDRDLRGDMTAVCALVHDGSLLGAADDAARLGRRR